MCSLAWLISYFCLFFSSRSRHTRCALVTVVQTCALPIFSTAMSFLGLYRDPTVAATTAACDWRLADLVDAERPVSLYLVIPPSDISRTKPLVRLVLNQIGRRHTERLEGSPDKRRRHPLLMMMEIGRAHA